MKKHILEFLRRGFAACGVGPLVLAVFYLIRQQMGEVVLTASQVSVGIVSLSALAFIAGGMNVVYQIERLPLMLAILLHGSVLYVSYLGTYLVNGWLKWGMTPILVFSGVFGVGYLLIWAVIYSVIRRNTAKVNEMLRKKARASQQSDVLNE